MMKVIKSHDLCPNLFHIEQLGNCLAGLLTPIVTLQKVCEKYYLISGESNVAEDQSGRATYIVFLESSTLISQSAPASLVIVSLL